LDINNDREWGLWLRKHIYASRGEKKIPRFILNNNVRIKLAFFNGYYGADGRKKGNERYYYKGWTTKSAVLNLGLIFLLKTLTGQIAKTKVEFASGGRYYYTQLRTLKTARGKHLLKQLNEVIKIDRVNNFKEGTLFDLQTGTHTFASGANLIKIHNSPRRGFEFVTRKITSAAAQIKLGMMDKLYLGNLEAKRDWGHAKEYVKVMHAMLQQKSPEDYVVGTGETHSVREFVERAFNELDLDYKKHVEIDKNFFRPAEVDLLIADCSKAKKDLNWEYSLTFNDLVSEMVRKDYEYFSENKGA
ncbi:MAG: GDP-mannose 4,6-dehydratase, partial [Candidatus Omnitrophota bacterium]